MNEVMQPQTILVTGGSGFIGTHLCRKLVGLGHQVRVLDLKQPSDRVEGVQYTQGDARNAELVLKLLQGVSAVYHLAATVSVPLCQKDPVESYSNNFTATLTVLEAIRKSTPPGAPLPRLIFASTAAVYGSVGDDMRALKESDAAMRFSSFYAAQKMASEQALDQYFKSHDLPSISFRFFNVFGPGQDPTSPYSGVITIFSRLAREGKPLLLNAGGSQTRDFVSVYDLTDALVGALSLPREALTAQAINLGSGVRTEIRRLAEIIRDSAGTGSALVDAPPRDGDVLHSLADIDQARKLLKFSPNRGLKESLVELLKMV
jgi:UDP-glucose 4-epimerase